MLTYIPISIALFIGYQIGRLIASIKTRKTIKRWQSHCRQVNELYEQEREFFHQAMRLVNKHKANTATLKAALLERLSPDERAEVERLDEVAELEDLFIRQE